MIFDFKHEKDILAFDKKAEKAKSDKEAVEFIIKNFRTVRQNNYQHLVITWFAIEHGYTIDFVKQEYFKVLCNPDIFVSYIDDKYLGTIRVLKSSSKLTPAEMTMAIERFRNWSAEQGTYLPAPGDEAFLRHITIEASKMKEYL
jgi:hypothetical protein